MEAMQLWHHLAGGIKMKIKKDRKNLGIGFSKTIVIIIVTMFLGNILTPYSNAFSNITEPCNKHIEDETNNFHNDIEILSEDNNSILLSYHLRQFSIEKKELYSRYFYKFIIPGYGVTTEIGKPELPVKRVIVAIPPSSEIKGTHVVESDSYILENYDVYPVQPPLVDASNGENSFIINETFYSKIFFIHR